VLTALLRPLLRPLAQPGEWLDARRATMLAGYAVALVSVSPPVDGLADGSLTAHMAQHMVLISVAAPLVAIGTRWPPFLQRRADGRPRPVALWAWPAAWVLLWAWHVPALYDTALRITPLHALEHGVMFVSWTVAWASVVRPADAPRPVPTPWAVLLVGTTALQSTLLGALLAFSDRPWYPHYAALPDAVLDQRIGGAVMSVAMGPTQLVVAAWLVVQWLSESERDQTDADLARLQREVVP